jgi:hypothetical protein
MFYWIKVWWERWLWEKIHVIRLPKICVHPWCMWLCRIKLFWRTNGTIRMYRRRTQSPAPCSLWPTVWAHTCPAIVVAVSTAAVKRLCRCWGLIWWYCLGMVTCGWSALGLSAVLPSWWRHTFYCCTVDWCTPKADAASLFVHPAESIVIAWLRSSFFSRQFTSFTLCAALQHPTYNEISNMGFGRTTYCCFKSNLPMTIDPNLQKIVQNTIFISETVWH